MIKKRKPAPPKYRNRKIRVDGIKFDSIAESHRYMQLKLMQAAGEISDLSLQVPFVLVEPVRYLCKRRAVPAMKYVADFVYQRNGEQIVEDVKGMVTREFKMKKHLMMAVHGIEVMEVNAKCTK